MNASLARAWGLLGICTASLVSGVVASAVGAETVANLSWSAGAAVAAIAVAVAIVNALRARRAGVDVLALLALVGALAVGEYLPAAVIALMVATGRLLDSWAAARAESDLHRLLERAPRLAHRYQGDARAGGPPEVSDVPAAEVAVGDLLLVKPGELVPADGRVESSSASLDLSSLTGEPVPVTLSTGELVGSGAVNAGGAFDLRAVATAEDSTFAGIVALVSGAMAERAPFVRLADRFAVAFVPFALVLAGTAWLATGSATRAVAVLVVATPCPLILAAPIALAAGLSRAARSGVIVKGGGTLERLATATTLVFDKTGTVTRGQPRVVDVLVAPGHDADEVVRLAASLEQVSSHVLADAVVRAASERHLALTWPEASAEILGSGTAGRVAGEQVRVGRAEWIGVEDAPWSRVARRKVEADSAMSVYVERAGKPIGALVLEDPIRPDAARAIREMRSAGITRVVMATGDRQAVADTVGAVLGADLVLAERSPAEKVEAVRLEAGRAKTVMVGDGVNDAPALAAADVGVALGARGATASSDAAEVVLAVDRIDRLATALRIARRSHRIALESASVGMGLSIVAMVAAALGLLPALEGAILQEVIDVVVILNALRALRGGGRPVAWSEAEAALGHRFSSEHEVLRPQLAAIRQLGDELDLLEDTEALRQLTELDHFLVDELWPHEQREQAEFYPVVARLVGGSDPIGPMSRAHVEIGHLVTVFDRMVKSSASGGLDPVAKAELRRVLYGLHAVLLLHFATEEEEYFSMLPESAPEPSARSLGASAAGEAGEADTVASSRSG